MKTYKIPVTWEAFEIVEVEAESLEEAVEYAQENLDELPLGDDWQLIDGTYDIEGVNEYKGEDLVNYIREFYNYED